MAVVPVLDRDSAMAASDLDVKKAVPAAPRQEPSRRFRAASRVLMAVKRFQAALNPTYTYGKSEAPRECVVLTPAMLATKAVGRTASHKQHSQTSCPRSRSGRTVSGLPGSPGVQHGFKAQLLLAPLPGAIAA